MKRLINGPKFTLLVCLLVCLLVLAVSVTVNYRLGFYSAFESESYISFFLGDKPFLYKWLYYPVTDLYYRAREISSLFNIADTYLLVWMMKAGFPNLLSGVYYLSLSTILLLQLSVGWRLKGTATLWISLFCALAFLLSPAVFLSGFYFRPSKILVSLGIALGIWQLLAIRAGTSQPVGTSYRYFAVPLVLTLAMGLTDEQGIFYAALLFGYNLITGINRKNRRYRTVAAGGGLGLILLFVYRTWLGPAIASRITGFPTAVWGLGDVQLNNVSNLVTSFQLLLHYLALFFGNVPQSFNWLPLMLLTSIVLLSLKPTSTSLVRIICKTVLVTGGGICLFTLFLHVLTLRLNVLTWPEFSILYYPLPLYTLLFCLINALLCRIRAAYPKTRFVILPVLILWVLANSVALPKHISLLTDPSTKTSVYFGLAPTVIANIYHPETAPPNDLIYSAPAIRKMLSR